MCVSVRFTTCPGMRIFDADAGRITLPSTIPPARRVIVVRAVLSELRVPQPASGAVCWCGEPVELAPLIPQQKESEQVIKRGA